PLLLQLMQPLPDWGQILGCEFEVRFLRLKVIRCGEREDYGQKRRVAGPVEKAEEEQQGELAPRGRLGGLLYRSLLFHTPRQADLDAANDAIRIACGVAWMNVRQAWQIADGADVALMVLNEVRANEREGERVPLQFLHRRDQLLRDLRGHCG